MKKYKYIILFVGLLLFITFSVVSLAGCANDKVSIYAEYPYYNNIDELKNKSTDIIKGQVLNCKTEKLDLNSKNNSTHSESNPSYGSSRTPSKEELMDVCTVYEVSVNDVFKGDHKKNDVIKVKEMGGLFEGKQYVCAGVKYMEPKKDYILFLEGYNNPDIPYSTLNPSQGFMEVIGGKIKTDENNHLFRNDMDEDEAIALIKGVKHENKNKLSYVQKIYRLGIGAIGMYFKFEKQNNEWETDSSGLGWISGY